ncbi:hypothetical protein VCRA2119O147_1040013 [Vibrio crassostreae]|nr:hypothetical protein VCHA37P193_30143 [Vibrio chagasii]CAK1803745.1 hypothetical protein VCRA2111O320_170096 [Vibrio crassostreae]CAK1821077.1 hypothetical protein VCRA2117O379_180021 [Vibrio crassostreae]CAK1822508.1 hypothetical protein VCRA2117O380_180022 [Vibrio crassostreae]CAK1825752.1 hypothetical protein VCRA2113O324_180096 [Vibrio crassostreae]
MLVIVIRNFCCDTTLARVNNVSTVLCELKNSCRSERVTAVSVDLIDRLDTDWQHSKDTNKHHTSINVF